MATFNCFRVFLEAVRQFRISRRKGVRLCEVEESEAVATATPRTSGHLARIDTQIPADNTRLEETVVPKISVRTPTEPTRPFTDPFGPPSPGSLAPSRTSRCDSESTSSEHSRSDSKGSLMTVQLLREQLELAREESHQRPHSFIVPRNTQDELITVPTISKDIRARNPSIDEAEAAAYAAKACRSAKKLYAILAYIKKGPEICSLLEEGISDEDLPLKRLANPKSRFALYRKSGESIKTLEVWKDKSLESFDRVQWWMTSPVFEEQKHYDLDDKTILPFIHFDSSPATNGKTQGAYSEVYPVRIHPAHHEFGKVSASKGDQILIAVKKLFSEDEDEFMKEVTILKALGHSNHPHLIKLLATYKQEQKYHLMFPYADANLRKYWEDRPYPTFDKPTVLWSLNQICGISDALLLIHNFTVEYPLKVPGAGHIRMPSDVKLSVTQGEEMFGRHGDIKPENILWFSEGSGGGLLQIADFGLGRFHGRDSRSGLNPETIVSSPTYEPPECKLRKPVSRAYDIWSLGCLYLEFITWLLKGSDAIDGFSNSRGRLATGSGIDDDNFYTITTHSIFGSRATVREGVINWTNELHEHEKCSELIHDLLNLIMIKLLVIDSKQRCSASSLSHQLAGYQKKAECDDDYLLTPVPRKQKPVAGSSHSFPETRRASVTNGKLTMATLEETESIAEGRKTHFKADSQIDEPRDLVFRSLGTPNKPKGRTWPIGG